MSQESDQLAVLKGKELAEAFYQAINKMSNLDLYYLNLDLQQKFGVTSPAVPSQINVAEQPQAATQNTFTVNLTSIGEKKIDVVKAIRTITGLGLKEGMGLINGVATAPQAIKKDVTRAEADEITLILTGIGAGVEVV